MIDRELAFRGIDGEVGVKVPLDQFALDIEQHELGSMPAPSRSTTTSMTALSPAEGAHGMAHL